MHMYLRLAATVKRGEPNARAPQSAPRDLSQAGVVALEAEAGAPVPELRLPLSEHRPFAHSRRRRRIVSLGGKRTDGLVTSGVMDIWVIYALKFKLQGASRVCDRTWLWPPRFPEVSKCIPAAGGSAADPSTPSPTPGAPCGTRGVPGPPTARSASAAAAACANFAFGGSSSPSSSSFVSSAQSAASRPAVTPPAVKADETLRRRRRRTRSRTLNNSSDATDIKRNGRAGGRVGGRGRAGGREVQPNARPVLRAHACGLVLRRPCVARARGRIFVNHWMAICTQAYG